MENGLFWGCKNLKTIIPSNNLSFIGAYTFYGCSAFEDFVIPNGVTYIGEDAFMSCINLKSITISPSVSKIDINAFESCSNLNKVIITDLESWCKIDFVASNASPFIYAPDLYLNGAKLTELVIPNSINSISKYAFSGYKGLTKITMSNSVVELGAYSFCRCVNLETVILSNSLTEIGDCAFYGCTNLSDINLEDKIVSIGSSSFYKCSNLETINIPNSVKYIGQEAFAYCENLNSASLGESIVSIERDAFYGCKNLESLTCHAVEVPKTHWSPFEGCNIEYSTLIVPEESVEKYKSTSPWNKFGTIKAYVTTEMINAAAAKPVIELIDAIGIVEYTDACKAKIDAARSAYDALTEEQQLFVTNISILIDAEKKYNELKNAAEIEAANKEAAKIVTNKINAIGTVEYTDACKTKIDAARSAYDSLTKEQQLLVKNYNMLLEAEDMYGKLEAATGITEINAEKYKDDGKYLVDGKIIIVRNGKKYSLNGLIRY